MADLIVYEAAKKVGEVVSSIISHYKISHEVGRVQKVSFEESLRLYRSSLRLDGIDYLLDKNINTIANALDTIKRRDLSGAGLSIAMQQVEIASSELSRNLQSYSR